MGVITFAKQPMVKKPASCFLETNGFSYWTRILATSPGSNTKPTNAGYGRMPKLKARTAGRVRHEKVRRCFRGWFYAACAAIA